MAAKPNIVLVHGAWADGSCWSRVIERLQADGYKVTAPQLPETSLAAAHFVRSIEAGDKATALVGLALRTDDVVQGSERADRLVGFAGNDRMNLLSGDDIASGHAGDDVIAGGNGNDTLTGFSGNDTLLGQADDDVLDGQTGDDLAGDLNNRGGVRVTVKDADDDGRADVVAGTGGNQASFARVYLGTDFVSVAEPTTFQDLDPFAGTVLVDGVYVG